MIQLWLSSGDIGPTGVGVEFLLLGAVRAVHEAHPVHLGPRQQRLVFAVLAWQVGRPVSVDRLISLLWPDSPPRTAEHAVRVAVSRLRSILAGHAEVTAQGGGYVLHADPASIDVHRLLDLVERARATPDDRRKVELLDEALAQWQGPALADTASDEIRERLFGGLAEARLVATEDRFDALLRLGRHHSVVGALASLAETYPARERLIGQLMLALHRGAILEQQGDLDGANAKFVALLALLRQNKERDHEGPAMIRVGNNLQCRGRLDEAASYYRQALELGQAMGKPHAEANALHFLGGVEYLMGQLDDALEHDSEALRIYLSLGGRNDEARARTHLANVHRAAGRCEEALANAQAALVLAEETGERRTETWVLR